MLISVIIPLFNKGPYIKRALDSVLAQGFTDYEVIVVDDGSTDDGASIARSFTDQRIRIVQQPNRGVAAARNRGIDLARGELIAFLDADDRWDPGFLEEMLSLHEQFPDAGIYACNYFIVENDGKPQPADIRTPGDDFDRGLIDDWFRMIALGNNPTWTSAVVVPRTVLLKAGKFNEDTRIYEDLELWCRIALDYRIAFSMNCLAYYRKDSGNRICRNIIPDESDLPFRDYLLARSGADDINDSTRVYINLFISKYSLLNAFKCLVNGYRPRARALAESTKTNGRLSVRRNFIIIMSYLPDIIVRGTWRTGIFIKRIF